MAIRKDLLDELLKDYKNPEDLIGDFGILNQLTKTLLERALEGEMTHHSAMRNIVHQEEIRAIPATVKIPKR